MKTPHLKKFVYALTAYATLLVVLGCILFSVFLFTTPWLASPNTFSIPNSKAKLSTRYFSVPNPLQPPCLRLELAQTPEQWSNGLAFRTALPENSGMLFMFPTAVKMGFGMTNVSIPLSMAFLNDKGVIQEIVNMVPSNNQLTAPSKPYRFAIQVNQGWFDRYQIKTGNAFQACIPRS
jgi:uncharacterized protein